MSERGQISIETRTEDGCWSTYSPSVDPESGSNNNQLQNPSFPLDGRDDLPDPSSDTVVNTNNERLLLEQSTPESLNGNEHPQLQSIPSSALSEPRLIMNTINDASFLEQNSMPELSWPALSGSMPPEFLGALHASSPAVGFQDAFGPQLSDQDIGAIQMDFLDMPSSAFTPDSFPYTFQEQSAHTLVTSLPRPLFTTIAAHLFGTAAITPLYFVNLLRQEVAFCQQDIVTLTNKPWLPNIDGVLDCLHSLLPEHVDYNGSQRSSDIIQPGKSFENTFSNILLYSIANGFAGFRGIPIGAVFKSLRRHTQLSHMIFEHLGKCQSNLATSLAENLFNAAVEACDTQAIRIVAQTMEGKGAAIDVNTVVCRFEDRNYTPLELAAKLRNLDTVQLLIKMGADPNKTHEDDTDLERGALELAFRMRSKEYEPLDEKIIQVLLEAGSAVRSKLLKSVARWNASPQLQKDLVKHISPKNHIKFMQKLNYLVGDLDNNVALKLTETLIRFCEESKCFRCITVITCSGCIGKQKLEGLGLSLVVASKRANRDLCNLLLKYVRPGVEALTAAFWGEDPATVHLITEHGATASNCAVALGHLFGGKDTYKETTTILAEAIYSRNPSLMLLAKQLGVWKFAKESEMYMFTALRACADVGDSDTMNQLLKTCRPVNKWLLGTVLSVAVHNGYKSIISLLLSVGASVNVAREHGVILDIIKRRDRTAIETILESDINIDESWNLSHDKKSVLELAGLWGDVSVIKDLLDMGFQTDFGIHTTALAEAVRSGAMDVIELLLRYGANPNASAIKGNSPLHEAVKKRDERMIRYLLSHGANPADVEAFLEVSKQQKEALDILLAAFVSKYPNGKKGFGAEILIEAIKANDKMLFKTLLEARMDIHGFSKRHGCTPLGAAIRKDGGHNFDLVVDILKAGESVERIVAAPFGLGGSSTSGSSVWPRHTALLEAIETRNEEMVKLILENGANVNRPARRGIKRTPLQRACEIGSYSIVQLLISCGANVNDQPALRGGGTALQLASGTGSIKIVLLLLFHKAHIDGPTSAVDGMSALEAAAASGRLDLLKILWGCTQGRGFHAQEVERAVGFAKAKGYQACVNCLEELHSASQREFDVSSTLMRSV